MWFDLYLAILISAWNSTKSAPLNGHDPKLLFRLISGFLMHGHSCPSYVLVSVETRSSSNTFSPNRMVTFLIFDSNVSTRATHTSSVHKLVIISLFITNVTFGWKRIKEKVDKWTRNEELILSNRRSTRSYILTYSKPKRWSLSGLSAEGF